MRFSRCRSAVTAMAILLSVAGLAARAQESSPQKPAEKHGLTEREMKKALLVLHERYDDIQSRLQEVEDSLEEWGTVSISGPILEQPDPSYKLDFDLERSAKDFFGEAKTEVQGKAAAFEQSALLSGLGAMAQSDAVLEAEYTRQVAAYAADSRAYEGKRALLTQAAIEQYKADLAAAKDDADRTRAFNTLSSHLPAPSERPAFPTVDENNRVAPDADLAPGSDKAMGLFANSGKFEDFQGLLKKLSPNVSPTVSNRSALITAAGDRATQALFRILGDPLKGMNLEDRYVYFAVAMVSIDPGWRTRKDYAAELWAQLRVRYSGLDKSVQASKRISTYLESLFHREPQRYGEVVAKLSKRELGVQANIISGKVARATSALAAAAGLDNEVKDFSSRYSESLMRKFGEQFDVSKVEREDIKALETDWKEIGKSLENQKSVQSNDGPEYVQDVVVSAVSPMTDVQNLDLASSQRSMTAFALSLSAALRNAGSKNQAKIFMEWAKSFQKDVRTASPDAAVNAFAHPNGVFGFQIGPRLKALEDPGDNKDRPANTLGRQTFPVLLLISFPKTGPRLSKLVIKDDSGTSLNAPQEIDLELTISSHWEPLKKGWWVFGQPRQQKEKLWSDAAFRILQCKSRLKWFMEPFKGLDLDPAPGSDGQMADGAEDDLKQMVRDARSQLEHRIEMLRARAITSKLSIHVPIPPVEKKPVPGLPSYSAVTPPIIRAVPAAKPAVFNVTVLGKNLDGLNSKHPGAISSPPTANEKTPLVSVTTIFNSSSALHFEISIQIGRAHV